MDGILGIRPFVPAKDFAVSMTFYEALGFRLTYRDSHIAIATLGGFSFILQNFYVEEFAKNCMLQMLVEDAHAWWAAHDPAAVAAGFTVKPPIPPTLQHWGLVVGFIFDPSGVLWHIAERPA